MRPRLMDVLYVVVVVAAVGAVYRASYLHNANALTMLVPIAVSLVALSLLGHLSLKSGRPVLSCGDVWRHLAVACLALFAANLSWCGGYMLAAGLWFACAVAEASLAKRARNAPIQ